MSWEIYVQDLPADAATIDDVPNDFVPKSIGTRAEIIRKIKDVVPFADFSDPSWGNIETQTFSIEVSLGEDENVNSIMFHVRGDDAAAALMSEILISLNMRGFDMWTSDFFDHLRAAAGMQAWRQYRDQIISKSKA